MDQAAMTYTSSYFPFLQSNHDPLSLLGLMPASYFAGSGPERPNVECKAYRDGKVISIPLCL